MPVCSIVRVLPLGTVEELMHYYTPPSASCNSASGRPGHLRVIVLTITVQCSILIRTSLKGKTMLPLGSIFFPLIVVL